MEPSTLTPNPFPDPPQQSAYHHANLDTIKTQLADNGAFRLSPSFPNLHRDKDKTRLKKTQDEDKPQDKNKLNGQDKDKYKDRP
jgi:hypothetical protein